MRSDRGVKTADVQLIADETLKVKIPRPSSWKPAPLQPPYLATGITCFWQSAYFISWTPVSQKNTITFYIKVKGGMTHGLYQYLSTQPDQRANIKCSVEGPYGHRQPLQHYSSVSYITGEQLFKLVHRVSDLQQQDAGQISRIVSGDSSSELILQDINESSGAIAFVACGHSTYVDETRKVVANNLPDGKRVDFFDQIQIW
ncbi:hypothetical protein E0198_004109 [Clavispora lusitaniae]|nr:hypothetical protein E0198_004109 [Clavispora lusitaniae]